METGKRVLRNSTMKFFVLFAVLVISMSIKSIPAFADTETEVEADPITVVNNLSTFLFGLIRAIGIILLGFGVMQVGLSLKSHDPSQRANGFLTVAGGIIITFTKDILDTTVFFKIAESGAMGEPGGIDFITEQGKIYHANYCYGDLERKTIQNAFQIINECRFGLFGMGSEVPKVWQYVSTAQKTALSGWSSTLAVGTGESRSVSTISSWLWMSQKEKKNT